MTYSGRVKDGMVVFDGPDRPADGSRVRVALVVPDPAPADRGNVGEGLAKLAGAAKGLPADLAARHDHYRRERRP